MNDTIKDITITVIAFLLTCAIIAAAYAVEPVAFAPRTAAACVADTTTSQRP